MDDPDNLPATSFATDKQTLDDLNLTGKYRPDSVYTLFNKVITGGAEKLLHKMFYGPLADPQQINMRSSIFQYFANKTLIFPFKKERFNAVENYFSGAGNGNLLSAVVIICWKKLIALAVRDEGYQVLRDQLLVTIETLNTYDDFLEKLENDTVPNPYREKMQEIRTILSDKRLAALKKYRGAEELSPVRMARYDHLLRTTLQKEMQIILDSVYHLDVYLAVSSVARSKGFSFATALPKGENTFVAQNLRHPCLEKAVGNPIRFHKDSNMLFLTGANMAGKSTFMKSFGIALYLGHMGFPVAAKEMQFSVRDGIYTSINVPDNLSMGYSHFYAEVLRVKKVAQEIAAARDLIVIFDELFKGTNVKDAYDATLEVTAAFAQHTNCFFIISTHITEAGEQLSRQAANIQFVYFPSILRESAPVYTYKLQPGISSDRHGMMIIEKEKILELIGE